MAQHTFLVEIGTAELPPKALRPLCAVGSRTLLIYMLHQPVIYGALLGLHALGLA